MIYSLVFLLQLLYCIIVGLLVWVTLLHLNWPIFAEIWRKNNLRILEKMHSSFSSHHKENIDDLPVENEEAQLIRVRATFPVLDYNKDKMIDASDLRTVLRKIKAPK